MKRADIARTVLGMEILIDTREQDTERARRRAEAFEIPTARAMLDFGDYTYQCTFPDGSTLHDLSGRVRPLCAVERKMHLDELAQCFTRGRERFTAEFERAAHADAPIWLLIENGSWEAILRRAYRTQMAPASLMGSILAFSERYGAHVVFCQEYTTPILIREILKRDLRERLERGEFDSHARMDQIT